MAKANNFTLREEEKKKKAIKSPAKYETRVFEILHSLVLNFRGPGKLLKSQEQDPALPYTS